MAKGAAWMVLFKVLERGIGVVSTLVLARLLVPADFGIVAMAISLIAILEILAGFSFDWALVQKQDAERHHYDTAWTLNILTWGTMALLMVLAAPWVAEYYREPRVEAVLYVLAIGILATGFENIGMVAFRKELTLSKDFYFLISKKIVAAVTGIAIALAFRTYWALVAGMVASRLVGAVLSYVVHPFRPRLSLVAAGDLIGFSKWLFSISVIHAILSRAPDFVIGRMAGPAALGIYNVGLELSNLPTSELVQPIGRAVFPGYAKIAHDRNELRKGFLSVVSMVALIAAPAAAGVAILAGPLVHVLLGQKWLAVIPIMHILAPYGLAGALSSSAAHLLVASGNPQANVKLGVFRMAVLIPALVLFTRWDVVAGAAYALLLTTLLTLPLAYLAVGRETNATVGEYFSVLWRPTVASLVMLLTIWLWQRMLSAAGLVDAHLIQLVSASLVGASVYATTALILWRLAGAPHTAEGHILDLIKSKISAVSGGAPRLP